MRDPSDFALCFTRAIIWGSWVVVDSVGEAEMVIVVVGVMLVVEKKEEEEEEVETLMWSMFFVLASFLDLISLFVFNSLGPLTAVSTSLLITTFTSLVLLMSLLSSLCPFLPSLSGDFTGSFPPTGDVFAIGLGLTSCFSLPLCFSLSNCLSASFSLSFFSFLPSQNEVK